MKRAFTLIAMLISIVAFSQNKYFVKAKIGSLNCSLMQGQIGHKGENGKYIYLEFISKDQDGAADAVYFDLESDTANVYSLISDLKTSMASVGNGSDQEWTNENYTLKTFDASVNISLFEASANGDSHVELTKQDAQRLITWLQTTMRDRAKYIRSGGKGLSKL